AAQDVAHGATEGGGGGRLAEHAFFLCQQFLCGEDFGVGEFVEPAAGFFLQGPGLVPALRVADADGGGDGFRVLHRAAAHERGGAGGLVADHFRGAADDAGIFVFAVAHPVRGDVPGVADGQAVVVRGAAEFFNDFEGGGFLALQAERVDRVNDGHRGVLGDLLDEFHAFVKVAANLQGDGAVHHRLGQLAHGDLAFRDQHARGDAGACSVSSGGGGGVAGGATDDVGAGLSHALGHGHGHATVLERAGRVKAFVFHVDVDILAEQLRDVLQADQRRVAFTEADDRGVIVYRQVVTVAVDQACVTLAKVHGYLSVCLLHSFVTL